MLSHPCVCVSVCQALERVEAKLSQHADNGNSKSATCTYICTWLAHRLNVNVPKHSIEKSFVLFADLHNVNVAPGEDDEGDVAAVVVQDATDFVRARTQRTDSLKKVSDIQMHEHVVTYLEACM
jgi:hypothetical protein